MAAEVQTQTNRVVGAAGEVVGVLERRLNEAEKELKETREKLAAREEECRRLEIANLRFAYNNRLQREWEDQTRMRDV
jgi:hypothetical protein